MKKQKILITGGTGMLASAIESYSAKRGDTVRAPAHAELDICDTSAVFDALEALRPDIVIHTAAMHVEACEADPESAFRVNAWATRHLARACARNNAILVYISSCGYFGDEVRYYSEYDPVVLKTVYARSKFDGERSALSECPETFAIRPGWLFGGSLSHKKNFVYQRYREALPGAPLHSANDKYGCPTFVNDLAAKIFEIVNTRLFGIYHVTNAGGCTRQEYVQKIVRECGLPTEVVGVDSSRFPRKAAVPACELLHNWNMKFANIGPMAAWEDAIERYVRDMIKGLKGG